MNFLEYYIFFGLSSLTILTTFSLKTLFEKTYEKAGLIILWVILLASVIFNINKLNLLWLAPIAFIIPYLITRIIDLIPTEKFKFSFRYLMSFFF